MGAREKKGGRGTRGGRETGGRWAKLRLKGGSKKKKKKNVWGGGIFSYGRGRFRSLVPPVNQWPILRNLINLFRQNL